MDKSMLATCKSNHMLGGASSAVSPMRQSTFQPTASASTISRNTSHRSSSSTFVNILKTGEQYREKEKRYVDKIKGLKSENKKLVTLLRDSEVLFYQKLQETKKESQNLSTLFK